MRPPASIRLLLSASCAGLVVAATVAAAPADGIFRGGPIVTVDRERPAAEAVAVKDGAIVAVGEETIKDGTTVWRRGQAGRGS